MKAIIEKLYENGVPVATLSSIFLILIGFVCFAVAMEGWIALVVVIGTLAMLAAIVFGIISIIDYDSDRVDQAMLNRRIREED